CAPCDASLACCSGACVSLSDDVANCGACNHACPATDTCVSGKCTAPCGVKINEVLTFNSASSGNEFVELYNSCSTAIDITGWKLYYRDASNNNGGADTTIYNSINTSIPAHSYFL